MSLLNRNKFKGVTTALITPFKNDKIDLKSFSNLLTAQIKNSISHFVVNGTTGESPVLSKEEVKELYFETRKTVGNDGVILLGTGSNSTSKTIQSSEEAEKMGADALLVVVPYYNKPPQRGLFQHFKAVAESVSIPIILYNVPGRTVTSLSLETIVELSQIKNIIGIKEASGNIDLARSIVRSTPKDFLLLSGDDASYVDLLEAGGDGVISVSSHILAKEMVEWTELCFKGQFESARNLLKKYIHIIDLLFAESNPIPVKKALQYMKIIDSAELRLPLVECEINLSNEIKKLMLEARIIE